MPHLLNQAGNKLEKGMHITENDHVTVVCHLTFLHLHILTPNIHPFEKKAKKKKEECQYKNTAKDVLSIAIHIPKVWG